MDGETPIISPYGDIVHDVAHYRAGFLERAYIFEPYKYTSIDIMSLPRDKCNVPMDAFARGKYELESLLAKVLLEEDAELEKAFVEFNTGSLEGIPKSLAKILTKRKRWRLYTASPF
ncbi:MAG UNVERIFIED_CONTAM: hypothetical protein LVQ98_08705 [Rickettsiaceae bacterium]|jgi:hypothetical protein